MAEAASINTFDALTYLSQEEQSRLIEKFDYALQGVACLVFGTGLSPTLVQQWVDQYELQTLTIAMGPLFSDRNAGSARYGKSSKAWSKYMKGACGLFAEYACRDRRAIVLTNPPPNIYRNHCTMRIDLVHPTVSGAGTFRYQAWPLDKSTEWSIFLRELTTKGLGDIKTRFIAAQGEEISRGEYVKGVLTLMENDGLTSELKEERGQIVERDRQEVHAREEVKRKMVEIEQQARAKKEAKREKAETVQKKAQERKEARRRKVEMEQKKARERKEAKRKKVEMEQKKARESKEAKRKKAEVEQNKAQERKRAKRRKVEMEQKASGLPSEAPPKILFRL